MQVTSVFSAAKQSRESLDTGGGLETGRRSEERKTSPPPLRAQHAQPLLRHGSDPTQMLGQVQLSRLMGGSFPCATLSSKAASLFPVLAQPWQGPELPPRGMIQSRGTAPPLLTTPFLPNEAAAPINSPIEDWDCLSTDQATAPGRWGTGGGGAELQQGGVSVVDRRGSAPCLGLGLPPQQCVLTSNLAPPRGLPGFPQRLSAGRASTSQEWRKDAAGDSAVMAYRGGARLGPGAHSFAIAPGTPRFEASDLVYDAIMD